LQTRGTYIEQFLVLNCVGYQDIREDGIKSRDLKVADVTSWHLDDNDEKRELTEIRLEIDDKLIFLSDVKALLLATEIMKHLSDKQGKDVVEVVKRLAYDLEVNNA
jgi:hypothetical protein